MNRSDLNYCPLSYMLHMFLIFNNKKVKKMVEAGGDIFVADAANWTPLDAAAFHCHLDVVEYLLNNGKITRFTFNVSTISD